MGRCGHIDEFTPRQSAQLILLASLPPVLLSPETAPITLLSGSEGASHRPWGVPRVFWSPFSEPDTLARPRLVTFYPSGRRLSVKRIEFPLVSGMFARNKGCPRSGRGRTAIWRGIRRYDHRQIPLPPNKPLGLFLGSCFRQRWADREVYGQASRDRGGC